MSKKPMFICITGIDGSGKTTHIKLLIEYLKNKGIKCQYKWLRFHHFITIPLLLFCRLFGYTRVSKLGDKQKCSYHEFYKSSLISTIYPWLLWIDTIIFTTIKVYIPMLFGYTIVCDRFIYDTLIDVSIATKNYEIYKKLIGKFFLKLIPKDSMFIMLSVDEPIIFKRRPELRDDLTFNERCKLYNKYKQVFNIFTIDNSGNIKEANDKILLQVVG